MNQISKYTMFVVMCLTVLFCDGQVNRFQLVDGQTNESVGFAMVQMDCAGSLGNAVSNEDGYVRFGAITSTCKLLIKHLNYRDTILTGFENGTDLKIILQPKVKIIKEVVASSFSREKTVALLKRAIKVIPGNYPTTEREYQTFYSEFNKITPKEYIRKGKKMTKPGVELTEAQFTVQTKSNLSKKHKPKIKLEKARKLVDRMVDKNSNADISAMASNIDQKGGIYNLWEESLAEFQKLSFLTEFDKYDYSLLTLEDSLFLIVFDQKEGVTSRMYKGELVIDPKTLAFLEVTYKKSSKQASKPVKFLGMSSTLLNHGGYLRFEERNRGYYVSIVQRQIELRLQIDEASKNRAADFNVAVTNTMLVKRVGKVVNPIPFNQLYKDHREIKTTPDFGGKFWEDNYYFLPRAY